jgi:hypothetical protein
MIVDRIQHWWATLSAMASMSRGATGAPKVARLVLACLDLQIRPQCGHCSRVVDLTDRDALGAAGRSADELETRWSDVERCRDDLENGLVGGAVGGGGSDADE